MVQFFMFMKAAMIFVSELAAKFPQAILTTTVIENGLGLQSENLEPSNMQMIGKALYASVIDYWCVRQLHF